jgi:hypothetical protein
MRLETFDDRRRALHFGKRKINLHLAGREFEPKAAHPVPGAADLCFSTGRPHAEVGGAWKGPAMRSSKVPSRAPAPPARSSPSTPAIPTAI